jgi:hypothetical protein
MVAEVMRYQESAEVNRPVAILSDRLEDVKKKIANMIRAIQSGIWSETTGEVLRSLEREQKEIEAKIERERLTARVFTEDEVYAFLRALEHADTNDTDTQRYLVNACISRIYLFDADGGQRLVFDLNYSTNDVEPVSFERVRQICSNVCLCRDRRTIAEDGHVLLLIMI